MATLNDWRTNSHGIETSQPICDATVDCALHDGKTS